MDDAEHLTLMRLIPIVAPAKIQVLALGLLTLQLYQTPQDDVREWRRQLWEVWLLQILAVGCAGYALWAFQHGVLYAQLPLAAMGLAICLLLFEWVYGAYVKHGFGLVTKMWMFILIAALALMLGFGAFAVRMHPMPMR